jgi:hypothetical protein
MTPPTLTVREVEFHERPVVLRQPFKFGVVTLRECPQVFVRARVELASGESAWGWSAEMLLPKWFDKSPGLTNDDNVEQLRQALQLAREAYLAESNLLSPFELHAAYDAELISRGAQQNLNPLVVGFGNALLDRAVLDAVCTHHGCSFFEAVRANLPGITAATAPDLADYDIDAFLAQCAPQPAISARHTVGLVDAITNDDLTDEDRIDDGLPQSLEACAQFYGCTHFKLKVGGDIDADLERLSRIAAVLDARDVPYAASLDGNEQYQNVDDVVALWQRIDSAPGLERLAAAILFMEQPITRKVALDMPIAELATCKPVEIDESDASIDAFPQAKTLGYTGVSSKSCKGVYRSLLNRMRCEIWNAAEGSDRYFMSGEDLVVQAGVALQQDLCLATTIGCTHLERNGHHYVNGLSSYSAEEQQTFLQAYPRMYHRQDGVVRLKIENGLIDIRDLDQPGYGSSAVPDFDA